MSSQHQAFNNKRDDLVTGIKHSVNTIADKCLGKKLITEDTYNEVTQSEKENSQKARQLLKNVSVGIQEDSSCFDKFVQLLIEADCNGVAEKLQGELKDLENRGTIQQPEERDGEPDSTTGNMMSSTLRFQQTDLRKRMGDQVKSIVVPGQPALFTSNGDEEMKIRADLNSQPLNGDSLVVGIDYAQSKSEVHRESENNTAVKQDENMHIQINSLTTKMEENEAEKSKLSRKNMELESHIKTLQDRLSSEEKKRHREEKMRRESEKLTSDLTDKNVKLFQEIEKLYSEKGEVQRKIDNLKKENDDLSKEIKKLQVSQLSLREESLREKRDMEEKMKDVEKKQQRKIDKVLQKEEFTIRIMYADLIRTIVMLRVILFFVIIVSIFGLLITLLYVFVYRSNK